MKKFYVSILVVLSLLLSINSFGQPKQNYYDFSKWGEVYFSFNINNNAELNKLAQIISIDKYENGTATAYANERTFNEFLKFGYKPTILQHPSTVLPESEYKMYTLSDFKAKKTYEWDSYPTYPAYVAMMDQYQTNYPTLCTTIHFGTTVQNRELIICKLTSGNNPNAKTKVLYTSSIHGDETTGYVLMLRLINYLLTNYGSNARITNMLDNEEIWICPLANPDGTYHGGNNTVFGSQRYNANYVDMNRNYKDNIYGDHPDGEVWQPETIDFMNLEDEYQFTLGINFHGGSEVCNYPWDNKSQLHADDAWWQFVCREYADTCHVYNSSYMTELNNGISNGYQWYTISGGRQDNANYFKHDREFTCEISDTKTLPAAQLPNHWNWNYRSFLNFIEQAQYGIHGTVTDSQTNQPIECSITIDDHDNTNSWVRSDSTGYYARPIKAGTYNVTYTALGYDPVTIPVTVTDKNTVIQNVSLIYSGMTIGFEADNTNIAVNSTVHFTDQSYSHNPITSYLWEFPGGTPSTSTDQNPSVIYNNEGTFDVTLTISDGTETKTLTKQGYITASTIYLMQNGTFTMCSGAFYDDGGPTNNYSNSKTYTMTLVPSTPGAQMIATFNSFATEANYDILYVYNGPSTSSPLLGSFSGNTIPGPFTSTASNGSLTFKFVSDVSVNYSGWNATLSCLGGITCEVPVIEGELLKYENQPATYLSWNAIDNASGYKIYYNNNLIDTTNTNSYYYPNITSGNQYCFKVATICSEGESDLSNEVCLNYLLGDVNDDNAVNIYDITTLISYIFNNNPSPFVLLNADANQDGEINVLDIIAIINIINSDSFNPSNCSNKDDSVVYSVKDGILYFNNNAQVSGIQIIFKASKDNVIEPLDELNKFQQASSWISDNQYEFIAYGLNDNSALNVGSHAVMKINDAVIKEVIFSSPFGCSIRGISGCSQGIDEHATAIGKPYPSPFNTSVNITYTVNSTNINSIEMIFTNINGQKVADYIVDSNVGEHTFIWQPTDVNSGVYFVTLRVNNVDVQRSKLVYHK